jgi:hypothetical protein
MRNATLFKSTGARAAALLAAGAVGGGVLAGTLSATAATGTGTGTTSTPATSSYSAPAEAPAGTGAPGPGGAQPARSDEKLVTGADLTTLKAAALKAVPGGTIVRVETDSGDATYEAHMTKTDGSLVTVKFDKSLAVTAVEDGMGK